jgi:hypothetical protein
MQDVVERQETALSRLSTAPEGLLYLDFDQLDPFHCSIKI